MKKSFTSPFSIGFSLVELLISLIIISVVIAAFAPIMTKKLSRSNTVIGGTPSKSFRTTLMTHINASEEGLYECRTRYDKSATDCKFTVPKGVVRLHAFIVGGGGGGAGGIVTYTDTKSTFAETSDSPATKKDKAVETIKITPNMQNLRFHLIGPGGKGGSGNVRQRPMNLFIPHDGFGNGVDEFGLLKIGRNNDVETNIYITTRNIGDSITTKPVYGGEDESGFNDTSVFHTAGVQIMNARGKCSYKGKCCWQGTDDYNTAASCNNSGYSGCKRTVCTFQAAKSICENMIVNTIDFFDSTGAWRLPTDDELKTLSTYSSAANLCSESSCKTAQNSNDVNWGCLSSAYESSFAVSCMPSAVWGMDEAGYAWYFKYGDYNKKSVWGWNELNIANGYRQTSQEHYPLSTRCVLEGVFDSYAGGGGAAGAELSSEKSNITLDNDFLKKYSDGGKIILTVDKTANAASEIVIKDKDNKIVWGFRALAGANGEDAVVYQSNEILADSHLESLLRAGYGGENIINDASHPRCEQYDLKTQKWLVQACTTDGANGKDGNVVLNHRNKLAEGGFGASSYTLNGKSYGGGGKGQTVSKRKGNPKDGKLVDAQDAQDGGHGYAGVKYDLIYDGASGGGGGGACAVHIKNIKVMPQEELTIQVGSGGQGGKIGVMGRDDSEVDGVDGVESFLQANQTSHFKISAAGGKAGSHGTSAKLTSDGKALNGSGGGTAQCAAISGFDGIVDFRGNGYSGSAGTRDEENEPYNAIGGVGGLSGLYSSNADANVQSRGCGGFLSYLSCENLTMTGKSPDSNIPFELYDASRRTYGTLGLGGGGGGWANNPAILTNDAGAGGSGLSGFVYLYWESVK